MMGEEKIPKAVVELLGVESYTPSCRQSTKIQVGHTAEGIIKGLPTIKHWSKKGIK